MIELRNVSKIYRHGGTGYTALQGVDLDIQTGDFVAIAGRSGSGKSTLLNMLTGIDHPSSGSVCVDGKQLHKLNENALASWRGRNIGIVFQFFQLIPTLTALENVLLAMDFVGVIPKNERMVRAKSLLELVGIGAHGNKLPSSLSGGEQQRAAIARALANNPPVLVADEPTGNLDSQTAAAIHGLFLDLNHAGKTVIVVTHDLGEGARFERIITMQDGLIKNDRKTNAVRGVAL